jgi:hypothetical protein
MVCVACSSSQETTEVDSEITAVEPAESSTSLAALEPDANSSEVGSLAEISETGGCSGYQQSSEFAPFATQWGTCTFEGTEIQAYEFPNRTALDEFFKTVSGFGITIEQTAVKPVEDGKFYVWAPDDSTKLGSLKSIFEN